MKNSVLDEAALLFWSYMFRYQQHKAKGCGVQRAHDMLLRRLSGLVSR